MKTGAQSSYSDQKSVFRAWTKIHKTNSDCQREGESKKEKATVAIAYYCMQTQYEWLGLEKGYACDLQSVTRT